MFSGGLVQRILLWRRKEMAKIPKRNVNLGITQKVKKRSSNQRAQMKDWQARAHLLGSRSPTKGRIQFLRGKWRPKALHLFCVSLKAPLQWPKIAKARTKTNSVSQGAIFSRRGLFVSLTNPLVCWLRLQSKDPTSTTIGLWCNPSLCISTFNDTV